MDKNCFNPDVFMQIFNFLMKTFITFIKSIKKAKKESVIR